jgi:preprotein translocase subunit Sec61beta
MMLPTSFAGLLGFWAKKAIGNRDVPGGLLLLNLCLSMKQSKRLQRAVAAGLSKHSFRTAPEDTPFLQWIQPATEKLYTSAIESW